MKPIRFSEANVHIKGSPEEGVGDIDAQVVGINQLGQEIHPSAPQVVTLKVRTMWKPTEEEINRIKAGAAIQVDVFTKTGAILPMSLTASGIFPKTMIN